ECKYLWGTCSKDEDCCAHLGCNRKHDWCGWDYTF
uniref:Beta/mu-theraphotoxin-Pe1a n=3 Tax=Araneae TaxID=6893 RepID=PE1A_PHOEV|nr:RecName: Full=Beta/mu-theraphotoxin-Pe1a; Short=Beta/mu-TRTX-Pe1a [Phormingochilus everetti]